MHLFKTLKYAFARPKLDSIMKQIIEDLKSKGYPVNGYKLGQLVASGNVAGVIYMKDPFSFSGIIEEVNESSLKINGQVQGIEQYFCLSSKLPLCNDLQEQSLDGTLRQSVRVPGIEDCGHPYIFLEAQLIQGADVISSILKVKGYANLDVGGHKINAEMVYTPLSVQ